MSGPSQNPPRQSLVLLRHPSTPCDAVRGVAVELQPGGAVLELRYSVDGDVERLKVPAPAAPRRADKLWQHTCFEAFLAEEDTALGYREFNFAPSTEWAIYQFSGYR